MNFSVAEGHVACAVECQGVQTDEVTESVVDCSKRKDECMFKCIAMFILTPSQNGFF